MNSKSNWEAAIENFKSVIVPFAPAPESLQFEWEYIGEGWNGDFDSEDPDDVPLLRFSILIPDPAPLGGWMQVEDASYCTAMPINAPHAYLVRAAQSVLDAVGTSILEGGSYRREVEGYSHLDLSEYDASNIAVLHCFSYMGAPVTVIGARVEGVVGKGHSLLLMCQYDQSTHIPPVTHEFDFWQVQCEEGKQALMDHVFRVAPHLAIFRK